MLDDPGHDYESLARDHFYLHCFLKIYNSDELGDMWKGFALIRSAETLFTASFIPSEEITRANINPQM